MILWLGNLALRYAGGKKQGEQNSQQVNTSQLTVQARGPSRTTGPKQSCAKRFPSPGGMSADVGGGTCAEGQLLGWGRC